MGRSGVKTVPNNKLSCESSSDVREKPTRDIRGGVGAHHTDRKTVLDLNSIRDGVEIKTDSRSFLKTGCVPCLNMIA